MVLQVSVRLALPADEQLADRQQGFGIDPYTVARCKTAAVRRAYGRWCLRQAPRRPRCGTAEVQAWRAVGEQSALSQHTKVGNRSRERVP